MSVVHVKSQQITDRDANPIVLTNGRVAGAVVRHARGVVAITNLDSIGSTYRACEIPSNATVISVRVSSPDIGTTTVADVGLYQTTKNGGAVADADLFGSAVSLSGGAISKAEQVFESGVVTIANSETYAVWKHLGLTEDSKRNYDVTLTLTGAADASGSVLVEVDYTI